MNNINMRALLKAGAHFGHLARFRNPKMTPYIYGVNNKISIINLETTLPRLQQAARFANKIAASGGKVLFVGTKKAASKIIAEGATKCEMPYVNHRWLGGMLTNYKTIKQSIRRLEELEKMHEDDTLQKLTKKEGLTLSRELKKLDLSLGGIKDMVGLPDALFVVDVGAEKIAIQEANCLKIPVIGIVDTNSDPDNVDHVIPGNDDAMGAISLYTEVVSEAILKAKEERKLANAKYKEEFVEIKKDKPVEDGSPSVAAE